MNEFALASGRKITVDGVTIRQVVISEFDQFVQHAHAVREWMRESGTESAIEAFIKHSANTVALLQLLTDIDSKKLLQAVQNPDSFLTLIIGLHQLNSAYFDEEPSTNKPDPDSKRTWFDNFQFLIGHGHQNDQIMQYTYGAFIGYVDAAERSSKVQRYGLAEAVRLAQHADARTFENYSDKLLED